MFDWMLLANGVLSLQLSVAKNVNPFNRVFILYLGLLTEK